MNKKIIIGIMIILVGALLLAAGCSQPAPPRTPTPTPSPTAPATTAAGTPPTTVPPIGMGTPGPTQVLPPQYDLVFQVTSNGNTANPIMYVALQGGQGMNVDPQVNVTLTMPNGEAQTKYMNQPFYMGMNVSFPCNQVKNRIEIVVLAPQVGYTKVYDQIVPFQSINP